MLKKFKFEEFKLFCETKLKEWGMYSPAAVDVLLMICAHESLGTKYRKQINGPALGVFQMEPPTHDSIWANSDTIKSRAKKLNITKDVSKLANDDAYALFLARHYMAMDPKPLPKDLVSASHWCRGYWNGAGFNPDGTAKIEGGGKATPEEYLRDYNLWKQGKL